MLKKWSQKANKAMFIKCSLKQIQTHLYNRRRKHKRAMVAVAAAAVVVVAVAVAAHQNILKSRKWSYLGPQEVRRHDFECIRGEISRLNRGMPPKACVPSTNQKTI